MAFDVSKLDFDAIERREAARHRGGALKLAAAVAFSLLWIVPFYFLAISVFKSNTEYSLNPPLSLPQGVSPFLDNVAQAWDLGNMGQSMLNSAFYGTLGASLAVFVAAMAAFAIARLDIPFRNGWFMLIFAGTVFPFQMYLIPLFFGYQKLGLLNSHLGMLLFYTAICVPFPTLVLRNFMSGLSREMDEAARMDGANEFTVFFRIVLPNTLGPMTAVFLLQFTWIWNDMLFSTVLGNRLETRSIMNALLVFQGSYSSNGPNIVLTAALLASMPSILLFFLLRKHFMQGLQVNQS
jgi:multiple sugar transport system permease protein